LNIKNGKIGKNRFIVHTGKFAKTKTSRRHNEPEAPILPQYRLSGERPNRGGALTSCQAKFEEEDFPGILEIRQNHQKRKIFS
jgi:hypothetical protein